MARRVAMLRGINLGSSKRIAMPDLRALFADAGYEDVRTYVRSGNVVLSSDAAPEELESAFEQRIAGRFGFDVDVVVRTRDQLADVVRRDPFGELVADPKRYQVSFLGAELEAEQVRALAAVAADSERLVAIGRELYAWHPDGVARSRLWAKLASPGLGVKATARNWTTVTTLLEMADTP